MQIFNESKNESDDVHRGTTTTTTTTTTTVCLCTSTVKLIMIKYKIKFVAHGTEATSGAEKQNSPQLSLNLFYLFIYKRTRAVLTNLYVYMNVCM